MKKGLIAALVVVVVLGGAAVAAVPLIESRAAQQIKTEMERDGTTKVGKVEVGLFDRKIVITDEHIKRSGELSIGHWEATGLAWPMAELLKGRTPLSGFKLGDPFQAKHFEARDLQIVDATVKWSMASLSIDDFRVDRYDPNVTNGQFTALSMRIAKAASIGKLEQKQSVFTDPIKGDQVKIASLAMGNFDKGMIGSLDVGGLEIVPMAARTPLVAMAEMKLKGLDLRRPMNTMASGGWRPGTPIGRIELESGNMTGFGGSGLTSNGITLGSISSQTEMQGAGVRHQRMKVEGFVLAPPLGNLKALQMRTAMMAMGLKELRLSLDCGGTEDRTKNELSIDRCALNGPDLGELTLSFKLVNADAPFWEAVDAGNAFAMMRSKIALANAKVVLADRGLVDRTVRAVATTSGQPVAAVRTGFAQEVRRYQPPGILITEDLTKLLDTVARFVEGGGTITVEAKPETPLGMDKLILLRQPGPDWVTVLGLSASLSKER